MPNLQNDPYVIAGQNHIETKIYKTKRKQFQEEKRTLVGKFLSQEIYITDYIPLSENTLYVFLFLTILSVPYMIGVIFIFVFIANFAINLMPNVTILSFIASWAIGYELIAGFILFNIFKSFVNFKG
ncbi:MAG: hypothetical protein FNT15_05500 [Sulfurovum sp.]|nr:MAG: hypothetical protein FNT15_05500 [Sulfurovum sp.]